MCVVGVWISLRKNSCLSVNCWFPRSAGLYRAKHAVFNIYRIPEIERTVTHDHHYYILGTASDHRRRISASEYHLVCIWVCILI